MKRRDSKAHQARREAVPRGGGDGEPVGDEAEDGEVADEAMAPPDSGDEREDRSSDPGPASGTEDDAEPPAAGELAGQAAGASAAPPEGATWAAPLVKLERGWTYLETRVLFIALMALTAVLCVWLSLRGMKEPLEATEAAGTIFRAIAGAAVLGGAAWAITRRLHLSERTCSVVTAGAVVLGVALASSWRAVGISYFAGLFNWLQEGSTLTLMGGLKGISTRLTMTVALVGASLAAASAGHINIDVVVRIIPAHLRKPVHLIGTLATALVCLLAAWGLFDHVAVTEYNVDAEQSAGQKVSAVVDDLGTQFFMWRKQLGLDISAVPLVLAGERYNAKGRMNGRQWNEWLTKAGFVERFGEEAVASVRAPDSDLEASWEPFVVLPGGEARGMLLKGMDLVFPFGFMMIGLRFILRALLVLAGCIDLRHESGEDELDDLDEPHRAAAPASTEEAR